MMGRGNAVNLALRLVLAGALTFSAVLKLRALLLGFVPNWRFLVPSATWMWVALSLEFLGSSTLLSLYWRGAAKVVALMAVLFGAALGVLGASGIAPEQCGCFGQLALPLWLHLLYLLGLVFLSASLALPDKALTGPKGPLIGTLVDEG